MTPKEFANITFLLFYNKLIESKLIDKSEKNNELISLAKALSKTNIEQIKSQSDNFVFDWYDESILELDSISI